MAFTDLVAPRGSSHGCVFLLGYTLVEMQLLLFGVDWVFLFRSSSLFLWYDRTIGKSLVRMRVAFAFNAVFYL